MRTRRPSGSGSGSSSTTPAVAQPAVDARWRAGCAAAGARAARGCPPAGAASPRTASPGREITLSTIACVTAKLAGQRLGLGVLQALEGLVRPVDEPLRRLLAHDPAALLDVVAGLREQPGVLDTCSGACTTTVPTVSKPARPARPAIWWNSRALSSRACARRRTWSAPVNSTVRIGTLMPTPRVSVPQMTLSRPAWASCLHQPAVVGQHPGVVHADPVAHQPRQRLAEAGGEPEVADQVGDGLLLLARA